MGENCVRRQVAYRMLKRQSRQESFVLLPAAIQYFRSVYLLIGSG